MIKLFLILILGLIAISAYPTELVSMIQTYQADRSALGRLYTNRLSAEYFSRMESFNQDFIRSTWVDAKARHDEAHAVTNQSGTATATRAATQTSAQQAAEASNQQTDAKPEPIRNTGVKVGRNDPCPCGSGKKYKQCCSRK